MKKVTTWAPMETLTSNNPRLMVIYGEPKSGKSTTCAQLEGALVIDFADEYDHIIASKTYRVKVHDVDELIKVKEEIANSGQIFPQIILDNASAMYECVRPYGLTLYKGTQAGRAYDGDLSGIPFGGEWTYPRKAFLRVLNMFKAFTETLILVGHIRDDVDGNKAVKTSINLPGQLKNDVLGAADTVGRIYRKKNQCVLDFEGRDNFLAQSRVIHLRGKQIVIAESDENGNILTHWGDVLVKTKN